MKEADTIRERIERATSYFQTLHGVVLTTFNLSGQFLEDQALPSVFGVDAETSAARAAGLGQRLAETPCTVYYDPSTAPGISGKFRYVARPVPLRDRFFHPKLVVLAGLSGDGTAWVYLAVSSANLTLSGWGRNVESFGETWIHTRKQDAWCGLDALLKWLQECRSLGEDTSAGDAVTAVRATLADMPDRRRFSDAPQSGSLYARFYSSVGCKGGLPAFLRKHRSRRPTELRVYSPYWGSVVEGVRDFDARSTVLVPALRRDGKATGLSKQDQTALEGRATIRGNASEVDERFWHMKTYRIDFGGTTYTAVGSCNFTSRGLAGFGQGGNVEAMLVFQTSAPDLPCDRDPHPPADAEIAEEDVPAPTPVAIVVAYDWRSTRWRWSLDADDRQSDFRLSLPCDAPERGLPVFAIEPGVGQREGDAPPPAAKFLLEYKEDGCDLEWRGPVVELGLLDSPRTYGRPLSASDILESWRGRAPTWDLGGGGGAGDADENEGAEQGAEADAPAAFHAVNLYDLYRAIRGLRANLAELDAQPEAQRALLVGRPDSVAALTRLVGDRDSSIVGYLVLVELSSVLEDHADALRGTNLLRDAKQMTEDARRATHSRLTCELNGDSAKAEEMLDWFDKRLAASPGAAS